MKDIVLSQNQGPVLCEKERLFLTHGAIDVRITSFFLKKTNKQNISLTVVIFQNPPSLLML